MCYTYTTILIKIHFLLEILFQVMGVIEQRLVIICLRKTLSRGVILDYGGK